MSVSREHSEQRRDKTREARMCLRVCVCAVQEAEGRKQEARRGRMGVG